MAAHRKRRERRRWPFDARVRVRALAKVDRPAADRPQIVTLGHVLDRIIAENA